MNKKLLLVIISVLIFTLSIGYFVGSANLFRGKTIGAAMSKVDEIIWYNSQLDYTNQIYDHCSQKENASEKLFCINQYVVENYNYRLVEDVYSIDEMFDNGADCKSYSIYYATLAKMMGYDYLFVQLPNHIFTMVYFDEGYCVLDEKVYACFDYGEEE